MCENPNTQTNSEVINRGSPLEEGEDSLRYKETNMGFTEVPPLIWTKI